MVLPVNLPAIRVGFILLSAWLSVCDAHVCSSSRLGEEGLFPLSEV